MKNNNPRRLAVQAVARMHKGGWANLTIKAMFAGQGISPQEKAFAAAIFYTTAERTLTLDYFLQGFLKQPVQKLDEEVRAVLETGLCQIKYMGLPRHAVINEMVETVRSVKKSSAAGLVNAVLRRAADAVLPQQFESEEQRISLVYSVSRQVAAALMFSLPACYEEFLAASFNKKEVCIRVNTLKTTAKQLYGQLLAGGFKLREAKLANCAYVLNPAGLFEGELFRSGMFSVQGEASQYICAIVGAKKGERVLDICAAPGGKSATLAQCMGGAGGLVCAELRDNRIPLIKELFARLGIAGARVLKNDAAVFNSTFGQFDAVLCDVPCSGLGVLGKKPDLRYTEGENFAALASLQLEILSTAAKYVKKGGRLVYATCTVQKQENEGIVAAFLAKNNKFGLLPPPLLPKNAVVSQDMALFLPNLSGLDGFFVAYLERL